MIRNIIAAALLALSVAAPAGAMDLATMSDADRAAFRAEVRAYLLDNPEVLMEAIAVLEQRQARDAAQTDIALVKANAASLFDDPASWSGGNMQGDITVVEFMDYKCGYCRKAFEDVEELIESDGNIRFVLKELPILGDESVLAARFAIATLQVSGDDAYKAVHDAMMTFKGKFTQASLQKLADKQGLDSTAILAAMDSAAVTKVIADNNALAQRMQISGTPTFVMGATMLRGYAPLNVMQKIVTDERAQ